MPDLTTTRLHFHYRVHGETAGLPVLLVHGSFASSRWWEPLFAVLPADLYAIAPDLRGCGQSDKPAAGYTIEEQAEDLFAFVEALRWRDFDLVAHASGGAIALEFALRYPGFLRSLTLVDSAPVEGVFTPVDVVMALEQMKQDPALLRQALALLMPTLAQQEPAQAAFFDQLVDDAMHMAPAAFTAITESLSRWNRFAETKRLTLPTLIIWGDQDTIVSRDATTRMLIALPGASNLEVLHGVGHSPMIEAPLVLAERLVDFITDDFTNYAQVRATASKPSA